MKKKSLFCLLALLAGCANDKDFIKGRPIEFAKTTLIQQSPKRLTISMLGPTQRVLQWSHTQGNSRHTLGHMALDGPLKLQGKSQEDSSMEEGMGLSPVVMNNVLYSLSKNGQLRAYNPTNLTLLWSRKVTPDQTTAMGLTAFQGRLFITLQQGMILGLDAQGKELWKTSMEDALMQAPCAFGDRVVVLTMNNEGLCFQASTGRLLWKQPGVCEVTIAHGASAPAFDGQQVIFATSNGKIMAVDGNRGDVVWSENGANLEDFPHILACPVVDPVSRTVYTVSFNGKLLACNEQSVRWSLPFGGERTPALAGRVLFVLTRDKELVAVDKDTGHLFWKASVGTGPWVGGPLVAGSKIYLVSASGDLCVFDALTGKKEATHSLNQMGASDPIIHNNKLYIQTQSGQILMFGQR